MRSSNPTDAMGEAYLTVEDLCTQFSISAKTVSRWRADGLVGRRKTIDGRRRLVFSQRDVDEFVSENPRRIQRARQFRKLSDHERRTIARNARRLRRRGFTSRKALSKIAREMDCSVETVRTIVKQRRVEQIMELPLDFIPSDEFEADGAKDVILTPTPEPETKPRMPRAPKGLTPYLASLYDTPLLTREQEQHLFRKYNYLKYLASQLREELDLENPAESKLDEIDLLYQQVEETRNKIIQANLRLVVAVAKKRVNEPGELHDLVSDGNMSLLRAIEKFDYSLGFKFSTYGTWAIIKNFARTVPAEMKLKTQFRSGQDGLLDAIQDRRANQVEHEQQRVTRRREVNRILSFLTEREQDVIVRRYGLDYSNEPQTLQQVGKDLGVSKERIRQLQSRAMEKLRSAASEEKIDLRELN